MENIGERKLEMLKKYNGNVEKQKKLLKNMLGDWVNILSQDTLKQILETNLLIQEFYIKRKLDPPYPGMFEMLDFLKRVNIDIVKQIIVIQPEENFVSGLGVDSKNYTERQIKLLRIVGNLKRKPGPDFKLWEEDGIIMIPTTLTTHNRSPKNHTMIWSKVITMIAKDISEELGITWLLVGEDAEKLENCIDFTKKVILVDSVQNLKTDQIKNFLE